MQEPVSTTTENPTMDFESFPPLGPGERDRNGRRNNRKKNRDRAGGREQFGDDNENLVPPTAPEIMKQSPTSVLVRWNVPQNDGLEITFFKIQYKDVTGRTKEDRRWKTYSMDISHNVFQYEVRRLKSDATYKFRVLAVYSNRDNRWSPPSRRFIMGGGGPTLSTPDNSPTIVKADPIGPNTMSLRWQYNKDDNNDIKGFYIYYKPFDSLAPYSRQEILGGNTVRYVLTNLKPGTYYSFKMRCYNDQGEGPYSNDVVKSTDELNGTGRTVSPVFPQSNNNPKGLGSTPATTKGVPDWSVRDKSTTQASNQTLYIVLGVVLGVALIILLIVMLLCWCKQRKDRRASNAQKNDQMHKKEQQMNGGPHHFLLHNMNSNNPNGMNGSIRNGRAGGVGSGSNVGTNQMSLTVNPYSGTTLPRNGDTSMHQEGSERNYSPEDLEIQNLRRSLQELLHQPAPPPPLPLQERAGVPVYYNNTASTVNINTRTQPNYYEVDPSHQGTLPRVHMATFGCPDCSTTTTGNNNNAITRSRPQSRAESSLSNAPPPEYNSLALRSQPLFHSSRPEIPDYSGSLHRQKPITNPYHIYNKDSSQYRNSPDHIPRSHERPPFRPHNDSSSLYSRSLRGPSHETTPNTSLSSSHHYPPGYDAAMAKYGGGGGVVGDGNPDIYEQVSDSHSIGSSSGRMRSRRKSPHRASGSNARNMGFVPVGQRMEPANTHADRSVSLGQDAYPTSQALPAMHLPQPIRRDDSSSSVPPRLPPRNLDQNNIFASPPISGTPPVSTGQGRFEPAFASSNPRDSRKESPQVIDDLSQDLPILIGGGGGGASGSLEASYGTDTAPPSSGHERDLDATTSDNLDSDSEASDNEGIHGEFPHGTAEEIGLDQEEMSPLVRPMNNTSHVTTSNGTGSNESTPLMQRNIPRANDYPSDDDNEDC